DGANIVEAALEVDRDRIVELAFRDLEHALRHRFAGVVQEEIDTPELRPDRAGDFLCAPKNRGVGFERHRLPTQPADFVRGPFQLRPEKVYERDAVARTSESESARAADAARTPGDDRPFLHERILHSSECDRRMLVGSARAGLVRVSSEGEARAWRCGLAHARRARLRLAGLPLHIIQRDNNRPSGSSPIKIIPTVAGRTARDLRASSVER